jgi:hypothetical protein
MLTYADVCDLRLGGSDSQAFTSGYYENVTNYTYGLLLRGSIVYRRTEVSLSLDRSSGAPAVDLFYAGYFLTVGNETRIIVAYNVAYDLHTPARPAYA